MNFLIDDCEIIQRLNINEGCRLTPYRDSLGRLSIGVGRCIDTNPFTPEELRALGDWKRGITKNGAFMLLRNDIEKVKKALAEFTFIPLLNRDRQFVLIDMCFQLGIGGLKGFKKALSAIAQGKWQDAHDEILDSRYAKQTPKRAQRNAQCILTGKWEY